MMLYVYVDYSTLMIDGIHVDIRKDGVGQPNPSIIRSLHVGSAVMLSDEDMEVEATVTGENEHLWFAEPNWSTRRDLNEHSDIGQG